MCYLVFGLRRLFNLSEDWISKPHIRISREDVQSRKRRSRQPTLKAGHRKEPSQFGKELLRQFEEITNFHPRGTKILPEEDILFSLNTERPVSYEEALLDRLGVRFSLQSKDNSAIVSLTSDAVDRFRSMLRRARLSVCLANGREGEGRK